MQNKDSEASKKIHQAMELLKEASKEKKVELLALMRGVYDDVKEAQGKATEKVKSVAVEVDKSAHNKPWYYIGGAALAGLVAGLLIRLRLKKSAPK